MKKALKFTLCMAPLSIAAGITVALYEIGTGIASQMQMPEGKLVSLITLQTVVYALISAFLGYLLSDATGLLRPFGFQKKPLVSTLVIGSASGAVMFVLEHLLFSRLIPGVATFYETYPFSLAYLSSEVFYGGVVEELLMRWFLMSLLVWILMKLTRRKKEAVPSWCFLAANLVVAVLFALGHLPATKVLFGTITPVIFVRCMLLNGGLGFVFGLLYRKWGIQYAMVAHALVHVVCDALLFIVVK